MHNFIPEVLNSGYGLIQSYWLLLPVPIFQICIHTKENLNTINAQDYLQKAKNRIEEIGQWGLMPRWKKISEQKIY